MKLKGLTNERGTTWLVIVAAAFVFFIICYFTIHLTRMVEESERSKMEMWAEMFQRKMEVVEYADTLAEAFAFDLKNQAETLAAAIERMNANGCDVDFYFRIIASNKTIPCVIVDENNDIVAARNINVPECVTTFTPELQKRFQNHAPIRLDQPFGGTQYLYFKQSVALEEVQAFLGELVKSFLDETVANTAQYPVIVTDSTQRVVLTSGNIDPSKLQSNNDVLETITKMRLQNKPIEVKRRGKVLAYVFYQNSKYVEELQIYPACVFFLLLMLFVSVVVLFRNNQRLEKELVWVGLAKETAHQFGTPLSSLMGWVEFIENKEIAAEMQKDLQRMTLVVERLSKIGSKPTLSVQNVTKIVSDFLDYYRKRVTKRVEVIAEYNPNQELLAPVNKVLFEWVLENLCKNAVDAMNGQGEIRIQLTEDDRFINIDVTDTGSGMPKSSFSQIFQSGYTTKSRGWGLGLSLSLRVMKEYHKGDLFVKRSTVGVGTTFCIKLRKDLPELPAQQ